MNTSVLFRNQNGVALVISLMFLAILGMLGTTAYVMTSTDLKIGRNYKAGTEAFFDAEAGVNFAQAQIESALSAGSISLPTTVGGTTTLAYTVPSGFSFSLSPITLVADNTYSLTSTGTGPDNSQSQIVIRYTRASAIKFAAFGDQKLDTKNGGTTLSYDSGSADSTKNNPSNASFQPTHEADVGSNDWLVTHTGASIDGAGVLGEKADGSATTNSIHGGTNFYNATPVDVGRVDPDPLGINSVGGEYNPTTYAASNDNLTQAAPPIVANAISTNSNVTLTGKAGGSNFYLTSVELKNGASLTINNPAGCLTCEVNIFLTGPFDAKNGSSIILTPNALDTTKFSIFSNSTSKIDFKHSSTTAGFVYAPYAPIDVKNSAAFYGAVWGANVDIKNSGTLYFDAALKNKFLSNDLSKVSWREVRN
ncbi:MAG: pilus assembly PilX N-terminal domain-containing protein [Deltaproteobacteria bacterium]|nr:pilus assembly PilX N-terminal domain-containing protein [Deltaproteobacteria bacterium]